MSRSYLFVPGDSERKLAKAKDGPADALILDLEDAVAASALPAARRLVAEFLGESGHARCWVRINPLTSPESTLDLEAVLPAAPYGIVLPKSSGADDVVNLAGRLDAMEESGQAATKILPIATEVPQAMFRLQGYAGSTARLEALTWGAEDLGAALGALRNRDEQGNWLPTFQLARSLCLLAASSANVAAVDTVYVNFSDTAGLSRYAQAARADGFAGMLAIHPAQVEPINEAFTPGSEEVEFARRVAAFFDAHPDAGVTQLDGKMIDRPHLLMARRLLELADRIGD